MILTVGEVGAAGERLSGTRCRRGSTAKQHRSARVHQVAMRGREGQEGGGKGGRGVLWLSRADSYLLDGPGAVNTLLEVILTLAWPQNRA